MRAPPRTLRHGRVLGWLAAALVVAATTASAGPAPARAASFCQFTGSPGPCRPYDQYGAGEDLRVTFLFAPDGRVRVRPRAAAPDPSTARLNTIRELLGALRVCFTRAEMRSAPTDVAATIRFAFARNGTLLGRPRLTYVTPGTDADMRDAIARFMDGTLGACAPFPFTDGLGGALAGRPLTVRIIIAAGKRSRI